MVSGRKNGVGYTKRHYLEREILIIILLTVILFMYSYNTSKEMVIHTALRAAREHAGIEATIVSTNIIGSHEPMNISGMRYVFLSREEIQELAHEQNIIFIEFKSYKYQIFETTVELHYRKMLPDKSTLFHDYGLVGAGYDIYYDILEGRWVYRVAFKVTSVT